MEKRSNKINQEKGIKQMRERKVYRVTVWIYSENVDKLIDFSVNPYGIDESALIQNVMAEIAKIEGGKVKDYNYRALFV